MIQPKQSYCSLCYSHCGTLVETDNTAIISVKPDPDDPVSNGYGCEMMQTLAQGCNHNLTTKKITQPYKKINGKFEPISWEQAIDEISEKLKEILKESGGEEILYMYDDITQQLSAEYSYRFFAMTGMKYFHTIFSWEKVISVITNKMLFNYDSLDPDFENSEVLMVIGKNVWVTQHAGPKMRTVVNKIKSNPNRKLIVLDPVKTKTTDKADVHVQLKPGTDAWFLLALMSYMYANNMLNKEWTEKIETQPILGSLNTVDISVALQTCGVSLEQLKEIANIIGRSRSFSILTELGINHSINQLKTYTYIVLLQVLTGNLNKPGGYIVHNHSYLSANYSSSTTNNYSPVTKEEIARGAIPSNFLSDNLDFKAAIVSYGIFDPLSNAPNKNKLIEKFANIPLKIAFGAMWNETVKHVDYILPVTEAIVHEYNISPTVWKNVLKLNEPLLSCPTSIKSIDEIIDLIDEKLKISDGYDKLLDKYNQLYNSDITQFTSQLFKEPGFLQMKLANDIIGQQFNWKWLGSKWIYFVRKGYTSDEATALLRELESSGYVTLPSLKSKPLSLNFNLPKEFFDLDPTLLIKDGYEFILGCGFRRERTINNVFTDGKYWLEMYPTDAKRLNICDGDLVKVTTPIGSMSMECKVNDRLQPGYIRMPYFKQINTITDDGLAHNREVNPQYKIQFANVEKV